MIYSRGILSIILSFIVGCSLGIGEERKEIHQELELYGLPPTMQSFSYVSPPSAVGEGDLSLPAREIKIYEEYNNRLYEEGTWALTTRQTMRRLAYCASQGDPFATLYLGHAYKHTTTVAEGECLYAKLLYRIAYLKIAEIAENPSDLQYEQANFQLALEAFNNCRSIPYLSDHLTPLEYLERIPTSRRGELLNRLYQLRYGLKDEKPRWEEFLDENDLKNHPWVFLRTRYHYNEYKDEERIKIYETAVSKHPHPAFLIELADLYQLQCRRRERGPRLQQLYKEKVFPLYKKAGELGCPIAYLILTGFYAPERYGKFWFGETNTKEALLKCCKYMTKAAQLDFPEAFYQLGRIVYAYVVFLQHKIEMPDDVDAQYVETIGFFHKIAAQKGYWWNGDEINEIVPNSDDFYDKNFPLYEEKEMLYNFVIHKVG